MSVKSVFIIDKRTRVLIFLGLIDPSTSINQSELQKILKTITSQAGDLEINSLAKATMGEKAYTFGNFEKIIIIVQHPANENINNEILKQINDNFIDKFGEVLKKYTEKDIAKFKTFITTIKEEILQKQNKQPEQPIEKEKEQPLKSSVEKKEPIPTPSVNEVKPAKKVEITEQNIGNVSLIPPVKRDSYPQGIPEYKRDEVLWEESQSVQNEYGADFVDGMISHLNVFLTISLTHHYEVHIDFSQYPNKPDISLGAGLQKELGKPIEMLLFIHKNWDTKRPPHIIELVREIEGVLMKYKAWGKLSETSEMPEAALPELEPLPDLPPLEEPIVTEDLSEKEQEEEKEKKEKN